MRTVLIADDSRTTQMLIQTTLQEIPEVEFLLAGNGREALAVLREKRVDLLVTDVNMPEMDGITLVREVRKTRSRSELPILIITGKAEAQAREEGLASGADAYLLKPLSRDELARLTERFLRQAGGGQG